MVLGETLRGADDLEEARIIARKDGSDFDSIDFELVVEVADGDVVGWDACGAFEDLIDVVSSAIIRHEGAQFDGIGVELVEPFEGIAL